MIKPEAGGVKLRVYDVAYAVVYVLDWFFL